MDRIDLDEVVREACRGRARELRRLAGLAFEALRRLLDHEPATPQPAFDPLIDRIRGLASFQARLKNSRPPRIAFIRSSNRSKCPGTSTKFRRSLFTMSSGLSE
jgi:hypothetical protein